MWQIPDYYLITITWTVLSRAICSERRYAYACIQSVAMTCQLRGISFHRFLKASLVCYIRTARPMLLAEYEAGLKPLAIAA
jgi:hypothetical protein